MEPSPAGAGRRAALAAHMPVRFYERSGPDARGMLERLRDALAADGAETELLTSVDRADLWLLIVRGDAPEPTLDDRTRRWRFEVPSA